MRGEMDTVRTAVSQQEITLKLYGITPEAYAVITGEPLVAAGSLALPMGDVPVMTTVADLYGLPQVETFSLYGVDPHCDCDPMAFCRNPLHPGPCKGWKRTLGAVAPGALRALEAERVRKANERRAAKVKDLQAQGKKVPARLLKPITLDPKGPGAPAVKPSDKVVGIPTANELRKKVDDRRAAQARAAAKPATPAVPSGGKKPRDGDGDGKLNEKYKPKGGQPAASPAAPVNAPAVAKALDQVNRVGKGRPVAKKQVEAYSALSRDDFDSLDAAAQTTILDDLKAAAAKFLDPKKVAEAQALLARFGSPKPAAPAPAPSAPTPGAPSVEAAKAAESLKRYTKIDNGNTLNDTAMERARQQWDGLSQKEREDYVEQFGGKVAGTMAGRTKRITGIDIGPDAQKKLQEEIAADILGTGKGTPLTDAMEAAWASPSNRADLHRALADTGVNIPHGLEKQLDAITSATSQSDVADAIDDAAYAARTDAQRAALDQVLDKIANDTSAPAWLRGRAESQKSTWRADPRSKNWSIGQGVRAATNNALGVSVASNVFGIDDPDVAKLPPNLRMAVEAKRAEVVDALVGNLGARENLLASINGGHPVIGGGDKAIARIKAMPKDRQDRVLDALRDQVDKDISVDKFSEASTWESISDGVRGIDYTPEQQRAILAAQIPAGGMTDELAAYVALSKGAYDALPDAHAISIENRLQQIERNSMDDKLRRGAALKRAEFDGNMPAYTNPKTQELALHAGVLRDAASAHEKLAAARAARKDDFDELSPTGQLAVTQGLQRLVDDPASGLSLLERGQLQLKHDEFAGRSYDTDDLVAAMTSVGVGNLPAPARFQMYEKLDVQRFDDLPAFFRKSIRDDLERLKTGDPVSYDRVMSRIDPAHQPVAPVTAPTNPRTDAALDVVYGADPKARTIPKQLSAYGGLKATDFQSFNLQEQNVILGDLSYIVTTSKDKNAVDRAQKLIDRFTPPGTPPGSPAVGVPMPPANAVQGQIRFPDPGGVAGMLKESRNPGSRGDQWMSTASGNRVWGKYGAAGLMLRHVDPATGEERFLIAQRGPGISNPGMWQLPGGAIESLETPAEGATRETLEELGFKASDFANARVHGIHEAKVNGVIGAPGGEWKYSSLAATVPTMLKPDLSTAAARAETSDAKWMTRAEIDDLDRQGKLLGPLAGGKIHTNITSLFPSPAHATGAQRPGPTTRRPARLAPGQRGQVQVHPSQAPGWTKPHKQSKGINLVSDKAAEQALSKQISGQVRKSFRGKAADERLAAIASLQPGFLDTPTVASKRRMDELLATGDYIEAWRGVTPGGGKTAAQIQEEFRSGPAWFGTGIFGNGYYLATQRHVAEQYASGPGSIVRVLIPKSAAMISYEDANKAARNAWSSSGSYKYVGRQNMGGGTLHDDGRITAAMGKDGLVISHTSSGPGGWARHVAAPGLPSYNWVNRSVLIVEEA